MPELTTSRSNGVQSVETAMKILAVFSREREPMSLTDIGRQSGIAPAKIHRYLVSLCASGMVVHQKNGKYDLGVQAAELGMAAIARMDPINDAADRLTTLVEQTNCTAMLSIWGVAGMTVVRWERSVPPLVAALGVGAVLPVLTSATGLAYLAWSSENFCRDVIPPGDFSRISAACSKIRSNGLATASETVIPGLNALAAPILDLQGQAAGVVTLISTDISIIRADSGPRAVLKACFSQPTHVIPGHDIG